MQAASGADHTGCRLRGSGRPSPAHRPAASKLGGTCCASAEPPPPCLPPAARAVLCADSEDDAAAIISYLGEERFIDLMFSPGMTHPLIRGLGGPGGRMSSGASSIATPSPPLSRQGSEQPGSGGWPAVVARQAAAAAAAGPSPRVRPEARLSVEEEQAVLQMVDEELDLERELLAKAGGARPGASSGLAYRHNMNAAAAEAVSRGAAAERDREGGGSGSSQLSGGDRPGGASLLQAAGTNGRTPAGAAAQLRQPAGVGPPAPLARRWSADLATAASGAKEPQPSSWKVRLAAPRSLSPGRGAQPGGADQAELPRRPSAAQLLQLADSAAATEPAEAGADTAARQRRQGSNSSEEAARQLAQLGLADQQQQQRRQRRPSPPASGPAAAAAALATPFSVAPTDFAPLVPASPAGASAGQSSSDAGSQPGGLPPGRRAPSVDSPLNLSYAASANLSTMTSAFSTPALSAAPSGAFTLLPNPTASVSRRLRGTCLCSWGCCGSFLGLPARLPAAACACGTSRRAPSRRPGPGPPAERADAAPAPLPRCPCSLLLQGPVLLMEDMGEWEIPAEELMLGPRIGIGSYGEFGP